MTKNILLLLHHHKDPRFAPYWKGVGERYDPSPGRSLVFVNIDRDVITAKKEIVRKLVEFGLESPGTYKIKITGTLGRVGSTHIPDGPGVKVTNEDFVFYRRFGLIREQCQSRAEARV